MAVRDHEMGSGNVFKDLGLPIEYSLKAQLVCRIDNIMNGPRTYQVAAGRLFGIPQPDVSKMLRGEFRQFSVERLLRFLVALNHDVEIVIRPHHGNSDPALRVA